jgi:hypothetical protein
LVLELASEARLPANNQSPLPFDPDNAPKSSVIQRSNQPAGKRPTVAKHLH